MLLPEASKLALSTVIQVKQQHLYQKLLTEGYSVGLTTVRELWREMKRRKAEVFIPLVHRPADEAQVDFFEVTVQIGGEVRKCWMFVMHLMFSGRDFAWLYEHSDQVSFLDGHVRAFEHFRGVPHRCVYDNLKAAVRKVVLPQRELSPRFRALCSHYLFEPCFARIGQGHDKGGVESRGKGIRLQHLTPIPEGPSLQATAQGLLDALDQQARVRKREDRTVWDCFLLEHPQMLPVHPKPFDPRRVEFTSADRQALVRVEGVTYSVPSEWARLRVTAYVGVNDIEFVCRGARITRDRKRKGCREIRYRDYLGELSRKPQAVRQVAPELATELGAPFDQLWALLTQSHGAKEAGRTFARVLGAVLDHGEQEVGRALRSALQANRVELLSLRNTQQPTQTVSVPSGLAQFTIETATAAEYDHLLMGVGL